MAEKEQIIPTDRETFEGEITPTVRERHFNFTI
jgi:hypothetical protein